MKSRQGYGAGFAVIVAGLMMVSTPAAVATTYTWDVNGAAGGTGGTGTWDTATFNWDAGANTWPASGTDNDAVFSGTAGTVTIQSGGVTANDVQFSTTGYTLTGGTLTLNSAAASTPVTYTVDSGVSATISAFLDANNSVSFRKLGAGRLTLSGGANFAPYGAANNPGFHYVTGGQLVLAGGTVNLGSPTGNNLATLGAIQVGTSSGGNAPGAILQSDGTFNVSGGLLQIGVNSVYGFYGLSGGTLNLTNNNGDFRFAVRTGAMYLTGGALTLANGSGAGSTFFEAGNASGAGGVVYATGGSATITANNSSVKSIVIAEASGTVGQVTIGGTADWSNTGLTQIGNDAGATATLNLNGTGRLTASAIAAAGTSRLNFDGGTLRAGQSSTTFLQGLTSSQINAGGAIIDTQGYNITIGQALLAPTGNGVTSIPLTGSGAGYIGTPVVQITGGGGSGATAVAELDAATGTVTGITITNPGSGYTSAPTVTLNGGAPTTAATPGTATYGTITGGGLTKLGSGTLTLGGANTYSGSTTVSAGTLALATGGSITSSTVTLGTAGGGTGTFDVSAKPSYSLANLSGNGTVDLYDGTTRDLLTVSGTISPGFSIGTLTVDGNLDLNGILAIEYSNVPAQDVLNVLGSLDISGATLNLSRLGSGPFDPAHAYVIASYGSQSGPFAFANISGGYLGIDYNYLGNQIAVFIPEPGTVLVLACGSLVCLRRRARW